MSGRAITREAPQALVPAAPEPDVTALVRDLRKLYYAKGIELMLRVGELILERLYEGDESKWKSRSRKDYSFRKLEQHPDLPFKAPMLSRAVSMYVLSRRRIDLLALQNVSQTHIQEVLNLDPELQDALLSRVEQEKWSVQRLRAEVAETLPEVPRRPGRPRTPAFQKHLRNLKNIVEGRLLLIDTASVTVLRNREAQELLDTARQLCQQAEMVTRVLAAHLTALERGQAESTASTERVARVSEIRPAGVSPTKHTFQR
jgi:hypothetical protein